jgi:uncharacterized protein (TIGR03546 family)
MVAGLTPLWSPHNMLVLLLVLLLRVNLTTFILAWVGFSGIAYVLDPVFHSFGYQILTMESLQSLWTSLYNSTLWRLTNFNNSLLMGSLVLSIVLFVPLFLISNLIVKKYREHILAWVMKSRIMQALKASKIYQRYQSVSDWGGLTS